MTTYLRSAAAALLAVAAAIVASRRLAGALETPLQPFLLLVAGGFLVGLAQIAHRRVGFSPPVSEGGLKPTLHRAGSVLVSLAMFVIAASLSLPGSHLGALLGFWAMIVGHELWVWRTLLPAGRVKRPLVVPPLGGIPPKGGTTSASADTDSAPKPGSAKADLPTTSPRDFEPADSESIEDPESAELAADVLQQLTLRATAEGGQELSGWLRIRLAAAQRTGSLHVAFCPAFDQPPQVEVQPVSGPDCRVKAAQVLPYGARLDFKLDEPARGDESVLVWLSCTSGFPA